MDKMHKLFNDEFFPTPKELISKMMSKVKNAPKNILEPSAGKGDIIEYMKSEYKYGAYHYDNISAIENDKNLFDTLKGKDIKVIDYDFLSFSGPDKFDLIIANPPFNEGDKHLLKAIDIMYRGEIVFLLNAETLKNPYTNTRKNLVRKLEELNADIEYISDAFKNSERPTGVEIALVYINIQKTVENDLFKGADDIIKNESGTVEDRNELTTGKTIQELVMEYNQIVSLCTDTLINYYRNYTKVNEFIALNRKPDEYCPNNSKDLTGLMQNEVNNMVGLVRIKFWRKTLNINEVRKRMTEKRSLEFEDNLTRNSNMDFTENNIRAFILNLIGGHNKTLSDAVLEIFDMLTIKHCYSGKIHEKNIHYFNGWKTNNAFKVNEKVIIPIYGGYGNGPFSDYNNEWKLDFSVISKLQDIDIVMNYFDGAKNYISISESIKTAYLRGQSRQIYSTYFIITTYKKGTIHLTFRDTDIMRRFNVVACKGKNWLPDSYGKNKYEILEIEEKKIADSFEGKTSYNHHYNEPLFAIKNSNQNLITLEEMNKNK